jgi:N-terminal domain of toast_rack, DUF2154
MKTSTCFQAIAASALLLVSCGFERDIVTGPPHSEPVAIDLGAAERANVELNMKAGQLNVRGGAVKLVEGTFDYNVDAWKPVVTSAVNGSHATVTIGQPDFHRPGGNQKYSWDLALNNTALLDLAINCGAGQARLDLGSLRLRTIEVHIGVGQVDLDLRGQPARDYEVKINGGIGQATVNLPTDVGVWAEASGGIGSINVSGLQKHGDHWENDLYDKAKVNVRVQVSGGIGEIRIIG